MGANLATQDRFRWIALSVAFVSQLSNALTVQALAPLAPIFQPELGLTKTEVGFFSTLAYTGAWGMLLIGGALTDRWGVRRVMSLGQIAGGVLMLAMGVVTTFTQAAAVIFLAGVGRGVALPGASKAITDWFPPRVRGTAMGIKQSGVPAAGVLAASILPSLALIIGWRVAVATAGGVIILGGLFCAVLYRDAAFRTRPVERQVATESGVRQVLRNRSLWVVSLVSVMYITSQTAVTTYLALYFNEVVLVSSIPDQNTRIVAAGGFLAACQTGGVVGRVFWGVVSDRLFHGRRMVVMALIGTIATGMAVLESQLGTLALPLWLLTAIVAVHGATAIGYNGIYQVLITETVGKRFAATGVGMSMTLSQFGTVGGAPLFGFVVDVSGSYGTAWIMLSCFTLAGALVAWVGSRREANVA